MALFTSMNILDVYETEDCDNIGQEFIEKVLENSIAYKRAVGFFSSSALLHISRGIEQVASHHRMGEEPNIKLIVSCALSEEDVIAIKKGLKTREEIISNNLAKGFIEPTNYFEKERLNMLCHHIASGAMEIKVALTETNNSLGIFHEKIGIMYDEDNNRVAFQGSLNETENAYLDNYEAVYTSKSWEYPSTMCIHIENHFDKLWENKAKKARVYEFPEAVKKQIFKYQRNVYDKDLDKHEKEQKQLQQADDSLPHIDKDELPTFPYPYQAEAINNYIHNKGVGIFDMATGTGKTFTGYGAMVTLLKRLKYHLATIIIAPYVHLVDQWVEDAEKFHIKNMIVGYSGTDYKERLLLSVSNYNDEVIPYFYFICTYATYKQPFVQETLKKIKRSVLFVADEAHNCGSLGMSSCLLPQFKYRLALSATIERYRDPEGTQRIFDYFGKKCIDYPLERAIDEHKLTEYEYSPIITYFNEEERKRYLELTKELSKYIHTDKYGNTLMSVQGEKIAIRRARLVAGCQDKVTKLTEILKSNYLDKNDILIYCGTSKHDNGSDDENRQIDEITSIVGNSLRMRVKQYTSQQNADERREIKSRFQSHEIQAIVAIKCLDEGVNIPSIRTAFILASSTNPREYIQRRGRVLRRYQGKDYAEIYDFITLPDTFSNLTGYDQETIKSFKSLITNEINRMYEFAKHSKNPDKGLLLIDNIKEEYGLYDFGDDTLSTFTWSEEE